MKFANKEAQVEKPNDYEAGICQVLVCWTHGMGLRTIMAGQYEPYTVHNMGDLGCVFSGKLYKTDDFSEEVGFTDRNVQKKVKLNKPKGKRAD